MDQFASHQHLEFDANEYTSSEGEFEGDEDEYIDDDDEYDEEFQHNHRDQYCTEEDESSMRMGRELEWDDMDVKPKNSSSKSNKSNFIDPNQFV